VGLEARLSLDLRPRLRSHAIAILFANQPKSPFSQHPGTHAHIHPFLAQEILGFDIFLDKKLRPYIIEVNRAPSFSCDSEVDAEIKTGVLTHAIRLLNVRASDKVCPCTILLLLYI